MLIKLLAFCAMLVCRIDGAPMYDSLEPDIYDGAIAYYLPKTRNPYTRGEEKFILRALKANLALGVKHPWSDVADIHKRKREAGEFTHKRNRQTLRQHFLIMIERHMVPEDLVRAYGGGGPAAERTKTKERKKRGSYSSSKESQEPSKESGQSSKKSRQSSKESGQSSKESGQSRTESREDAVEEHVTWPEYEMQQLINELDDAINTDSTNAEMVNELLHESHELDLSQFQEMTEEQREQREYEMQQLINEMNFDGK